MRNVVYLLLVANLLYLGWNLSRTEVEADPSAGWPAVPDTVSKLVTLQEMQQQSATTGENPSADTIESPADAEQVVESAPPGSVDGSLPPELLTQAQPPGAGQPACQALGPFSARAELRAAAGRLDELGLAARERVSNVREDNGYWVYLPAGRPGAVQEVIALLEQHGDRDYYAGRGNYIALGTFTELKRAERRKEHLRKLGLDAVLAPRFEQRETWWLEFRKPSGTVLTDIIARHPDLQLQARACP